MASGGNDFFGEETLGSLGTTYTKTNSSVGQSSLSSGYVAGNDFFGEDTLGALGSRVGDDRFAGGGEILQFPSDVSGDPGMRGIGGNHGHYIMFYINEQTKAEMTMGEPGSGGSQAENLAEPYAVPSFINSYSLQSGKHTKKKNNSGLANNVNADISDAEIMENLSGDKEFVSAASAVREDRTVTRNLRGGLAAGGSTIRVKRAPTRRLKTSIAMYMPSSVQVTYGANYQDTQIGAITEGTLNTFNEFAAGRISDGVTSLKTLGDQAADGLQSFLLGAVGVIPGLGGLRETAEMKSGVVIADRLELAFKGVNKRAFQYTFKMTPKDKAEVDMIRKIIFAFKANMLPEFLGGHRGGRRLTVPNTFDIAYMYSASQNLHIHNISTCVLENMNVTYGGDRYRTFEPDAEGAQPVETTITLNFKEMELITRERVFEGF